MYASTVKSALIDCFSWKSGLIPNKQDQKYSGRPIHFKTTHSARKKVDLN